MDGHPGGLERVGKVVEAVRDVPRGTRDRLDEQLARERRRQVAGRPRADEGRSGRRAGPRRGDQPDDPERFALDRDLGAHVQLCDTEPSGEVRAQQHLALGEDAVVAGSPRHGGVGDRPRGLVDLDEVDRQGRERPVRDGDPRAVPPVLDSGHAGELGDGVDPDGPSGVRGPVRGQRRGDLRRPLRVEELGHLS
ncbi:hypothetical protein D3C74_343920 [compost metagenome]